VKTSDFNYELPEEAIAQQPANPRDSSRLLVLQRERGTLTHTIFREIDRFISPGDLLVLNNTRVIPARLHGNKIPTGGQVEILLLRPIEGTVWEAMVGGRRINAGLRIQIDQSLEAEVIEHLGGARRVVRFSRSLEPMLSRIGQLPLPPYIHSPIEDPERYQTVYAQHPGSVAAPTAGLHFTPELLARLRRYGLLVAEVTLHIGLDTFAPVTEKSPEEHTIHSEWCQVSEEVVALVNQVKARQGRIIAVGTTSVRALESAALKADPGDLLGSWEGSTDLYILPGYQFKVVDALVTNFHLPGSTLIMMVSAFAGKLQVMEAYQTALDAGYRFYSFGDAMLIL
jgi:S-adenosylmethionine:tRNA ribosyltransferase-isomerase